MKPDQSRGRRAIFFEDSTIDAIARGLILAITALLWVILLVRIVGLRSFSKMTSFDFIMTIAMGSLVGSSARVTELDQFIQACAAMAGLFLIQFLIAKGREIWDPFGGLVQNEPLLLMKDGEILQDALNVSRVARGDLVAKLRANNVHDFSEVRAAVLETTGDVSVIKGDSVAPILIENVRRAGSTPSGRKTDEQTRG